jgi:hypothetical protein
MKKIPSLYVRDWEGIVWHHPDHRRMAKIKKKDFRAPVADVTG